MCYIRVAIIELLSLLSAFSLSPLHALQAPYNESLLPSAFPLMSLRFSRRYLSVCNLLLINGSHSRSSNTRLILQSKLGIDMEFEPITELFLARS
jgi:hypothetical protein